MAIRLATVLLLVGGVAQAAEPDPDTQAAHRHFESGLRLYAEERYGEAIEEFEVARRLRPSPAFD
jgi:hypothetical protein